MLMAHPTFKVKALSAEPTGSRALKSLELVSTRLANLKEHCSCVMINYLTVSTDPSEDNMRQIKESQQKFFREEVAERNPDLLLDLCDYWLNQIFFKVPSSGEAGRSSFYQNLVFVLEFLENFQSIPLHDLESFEKWLNFIRFIPREHTNLSKIQNVGVAATSPKFDCQKVIDEHIFKMLQF